MNHLLLAYTYLSASVVFVTGFAMCYKFAAKLGCELRAVNLWMNVGATALIVVSYVIAGSRFNSSAASLGLVTGICVYFSTLSFFYHIRMGGNLAVSWTVIGLAVGFPIIASILAWHEQPTLRQWVGIALMPCAFVLLGLGRRPVKQ